MKQIVTFQSFFNHLTVLIAIILISLEIFAFMSQTFYQKQYAKLNTAEAIGISEEDLQKATRTVLEYTRGNRENMDLSVTIHKYDGMTIESTEVQMYNEREILHMKDVQALYLGAWRLVKILGIIAVGFLISQFFLSKKIPHPEFWQSKKKGYLLSLCLFGGVLLLIGIWAAIDFAGFWTNFHKVFFTNDLWLLNEHTDRLIQMVPEPFFRALVSRIIISSAAMITVFSALSFLITTKLSKRN